MRHEALREGATQRAPSLGFVRENSAVVCDPRELDPRSPAHSGRIVLVDDSVQVLQDLTGLLSSDGYRVTRSQEPRHALLHLEDPSIDVLLADVRLNASIDGLSLARNAKSRHPDLATILYTRFGSEAEEDEALQLGAADYVVLPGHRHEALTVRNAVRAAVGGLRLWTPASTRRTAADRVIACSLQMRNVVRDVCRVAADDAHALIVGETGTGKDLIARALHAGSVREFGPFVPVTCGALATGLAAATFFGSIKGAYTGSQEDRAGLVEEARDGTLFLDELGELPSELQPLLLRFLEAGEFRRLGEAKVRQADVRVIAATNRDLVVEVMAGRLREDLLHRFGRVVHLPPLRERLSDLDAFVTHWCSTWTDSKEPLRITPDALTRLHRHSWPGNLRELRSVLERASQRAYNKMIDRTQIEQAIGECLYRTVPHLPTRKGSLQPMVGESEETERRLLMDALAENQWHRGRTAKALGTNRWSLRKRMRRLGILG